MIHQSPRFLEVFFAFIEFLASPQKNGIFDWRGASLKKIIYQAEQNIYRLRVSFLYKVIHPGKYGESSG